MEKIKYPKGCTGVCDFNCNCEIIDGVCVMVEVK